MEKIREHIYLAALLHDIGKFYQRADTGSVSTSKKLNEKVKKLEGQILPSYKGITSHKHALWTAQFIADNEVVFKNLIGADLSDLSNKNNLIQLASGHHLPKIQQTELGKIIKEADMLSSGMDRESEIALRDEQDEQEKNWDAFKRKRMISILETIHLDNNEIVQKGTWKHLPVTDISLSKSYFPKDKFDEQPDYETLWNKFERDFKFIQSNTYRAFSETLLSLLFKYICNVPASTINFPDVSLYDHSKMTAALAVCLYDYQQATDKPEKEFLLIGADFSGIQNYIYQIVSKHASKNLKGRSFYLRILSDAVVKYILKELNLFQANVIYNSGGSFYIIAPNTSFVKEQLKNIVRKLEQDMFKTHGSTLFLAMDAVEVSKATLMRKSEETLTDVWGQLFISRDKKKSQKFSGLIEKNYSMFFIPTSFGIETDSITGEGFSKDEKKCWIDEVGYVKELTKQQIELGKRLRDADFLVASEEAIPYWKDKNPIEPIGLGLYFYLLKKEDIGTLKKELHGSADKITITTFNGKDGNCQFMYADQDSDFMVSGSNNIYALEFYGGNIFDGKTFDEFCQKESEEAFHRLGVLRMDVDDLGYIFQNGIPPERATLSRYAALSRSFDYFFSGYLNTIQQAIAPNTSFIIYSGGDDLFIVASWEDAVKLAKQIRDDFKVFTCDNPAFTVSGGIAIVSSKFPIMKAAKESEDEENNAKRHSNEGQLKNSVSFMDMPLNWEHEFPQVEELKDKIVELTRKDNDNAKEVLPKSFISKILLHAENAAIRNHKIWNLKTYWMVAYDLGRMIGRNTRVEAKELIENCKTEICGNKATLNGSTITTKYHPLELWAFAARWAELEIRTIK
jgi:CRISPR-associated protein Csm1